MNFFGEYSLLAAILSPVSALAALNAVLIVMGERSTLMLPSLARYPSLRIDESAGICEATVINDARQALPAQAHEALTRDARPANAHAHSAEMSDAA